MSTDASWVASMPAMYDRCRGPALFHPFAQDLGTRAAATSPTRVLKIAAGTGIAPAELMRSRMTAILGAGPVVGELAALVVSALKQA